MNKRIFIGNEYKNIHMKMMDISLARTFLEVLASGSFGAAAERLHLTQTAVSARIKALEDQLGRRLFVRNKAGARLTPAGERFVHHAMTLIQVWERARYQVALPPAAILNLHERIENKLFLDRTRKDSNFKRSHIYATLFQIEKCCSAGSGGCREYRWRTQPLVSAAG